MEEKLSAKDRSRIGFFGCFGVVLAIPIFVFTAALWTTVLSPKPKTQAGAPHAAPVAASTAAAPPATSGSTNPQWVYDSQPDPMHDVATKTACVTSADQLQLDFPYHNTNAQLCVRSSGKHGEDAYVQLNADGQILCGFGGCRLPIRFGKDPAQAFPAVRSDDGSTNVIFIRCTPEFVAKLKASSGILVELQLYQAGSQTLTFNTTGLKWP